MVRAVCIALGMNLLVALWPAQAADYLWLGTCGTPDWYGTCHIGQCGDGSDRIFSNWGTEACSPALPGFPAGGNEAVVPTTVALSNDATVGWLTLPPAGGGVLTVSWGETELTVLQALANSAEMILVDGATLAVPGGTITNDGLIVLRYGGYFGGGVLQVPADLMLAGTGAVVLESGSGRVEGAATITNGAGHTIRGGAGWISANLVNAGTVDANVADGAISLQSPSTVNHALIRASDGGDIRLSTTATQSANGRIEADGDGSVVLLLGGAAVSGGTLTSTGGGKVFESGGGVIAEVADVANTGYWGIENGATLDVSGTTLTNDGTIELGLYTGGSGWPQMVFASGVTLEGSGDLKTSKGYLRGGPFTNGPTHTIHGWAGTIEAELVNQGTVDSDTDDQVITLNSGGKTNHGLIRASAGGDLSVSTTVTQSANGRMVADGAGSYIYLGTGAHVIGGALTTTGNGKLWTGGGGVAPELTDVTLTGYWGIENGAQPSLTGEHTVNDGAIEVGLYMGGSGPPTLHVDDPISLSGSGELYFSGGRLATASGVTWSNAEDHTIHGACGSFVASMLNLGALVSDLGGGTFTIHVQPPGMTNAGMVQVDDGSTMTITGADLFSQTSGTTLVRGALNLSGGPLSLAGGTLAGDGAVYGSVANAGGAVNPGSPTGELVVHGDYTQGDGGRLRIEIAGSDPGTFDVLDVSGAATLAGQLELIVTAGFVPQPGQQLTVLTASSVSGSFAPPADGNDHGYEVTVTPSSVVVTITGPLDSIFSSGFEGGSTADWSASTP